MRILILNADYDGFLDWLYARSPGLSGASYAEQMARRNESLFGTADFYSRGFESLGCEAADIHVNNPWAQSAWAREHGMASPPAARRAASPLLEKVKHSLRAYHRHLAPLAKKLGLHKQLDDGLCEILLAQIEDYDPDVILNFDLFLVNDALASAMKKKGRALVCYCGIAPPTGQNLAIYDLCLSMLDWVVAQFRSQGLKAEKSHLAFERSIVERLAPPTHGRDVDVSFVGSLTAAHAERIAFLEEIARNFALQLWMPSIDALSTRSPLRACYRGEAYGREAYDIMRRSRVTLNAHVGAARGQAANMRQFEATGVGALLLTDNKGKLEDLFVPEAEVVTYGGVGDALAKIRRYLDDPLERDRIAQAGQARTLSSHTYEQRTRQIKALIESHAR